jgi:hypothetical protein
MDPHDIQRAVRAKRIDRTAGDAPSLGRLGRLPGTGLQKGGRWKKKRRDQGRGSREQKRGRLRVFLWSGVLAVIAAGVLAAVVGIWLRSGMNRNKLAASAQAAKPSARAVPRFESPTEEVAMARVTQALKIRDPGKVAEFFRMGSASPEVVVRFLSGMKELDGAITRCDWRSSMDANGLLLDGVVVNTRKEGKRRNRLAFLTPDQNGQWKIDFDAFARTVNPLWGELFETSADQGVVRILFAKDNYYNGPFSDEGKWVCYGMASPDLESGLLGYCRKGSPQAVAMARINWFAGMTPGNGRLQRATLEIRRVEGAASRQFEITRVLAEDWVMSAVPFDQQFQ